MRMLGAVIKDTGLGAISVLMIPKSISLFHFYQIG